MKILIVKTSSLGDIIQALSVLDWLHSHFPKVQIDWIVEKSFEEILQAHPKIYRVIPLNIRKWKKGALQYRSEIKQAVCRLRENKYDCLIDLQGNIKSGILTALARSKEKIGMAFSSAPEWLNSLFLTHRYPLNQNSPISFQYLSILEQHWKIKKNLIPENFLFKISQKEEEWIASILRENKKIMVCPASRWENKKLSFSNWIEILTKETPCHFYFAWGTEKEKKEAEAFHRYFLSSSTLLPKVSLPVWQRLMDTMDSIYSVDSSALHLAGTTKTPTYSFFGPSASKIYKPPGKQHRAFQGECPYGKKFVKRCPILRTCKTGACLKNPSHLSKWGF